MNFLFLFYQTSHGSLLPLLQSRSSVPPENVTLANEETAPAWMPPAKVRGTVDILYSCLITLTLCVYTAVHINVSPRGVSQWWWYMQKSKWTALGIFAPEVVLFTAWDQFWKATRLRKTLNKEAKKQFDDPTSVVSHTFKVLVSSIR